MSQIRTTKEERTLLAIAKAVKSSSSTCVNVEAIFKTMGFSEKQARKALHLLARGNFIIKRGEWVVEMTPHGLRTAEQFT
jgi:Mn-dependent DtxR family transcriptional regulator